MTSMLKFEELFSIVRRKSLVKYIVRAAEYLLEKCQLLKQLKLSTSYATVPQGKEESFNSMLTNELQKCSFRTTTTTPNSGLDMGILQMGLAGYDIVLAIEVCEVHAYSR